MDQASRIKKNSLFALLSHLVRLFTNVILFIGIARFYGVVEFGQFTSAHTLATIFLFLADFGYDVLLASEVARNRAKAFELAQTYLSMKLLTALLAALSMAFVAHFQNVSQTTQTLMYVFSAFVLVSALVNLFFALFKGLEELHHETKVAFFMNSLLLVAVVLLGIMNSPLVVLALAFIASRIIGLVLVLVIASRTLAIKQFRFTFAAKSDFLLICVFGLHAVFGNLYFVQDTILLSFWKGDHEAGIYQSVFKLVAVVLVAQDVVASALLPVLSRLHEADQQLWARVGKLMYKTLFLLGLPIGLTFFVYADQIITLVYGMKGFNEAIPILRIFGLVVFVRFAVETFAMMLTTSKRQDVRMAVVIAATLANYLLNLYLIPEYGAMGAAYASLATSVLVGIGYILPTRMFFHQWVLTLQSVVPFVLTAAIGAVLWTFRGIPIWYTAPLAISVCVLVSYLVGYSKDDRRLMFARNGHGLDMKSQFKRIVF
jgi:O-antigen/teichoic acid export membrane protein